MHKQLHVCWAKQSRPSLKSSVVKIQTIPVVNASKAWFDKSAQSLGQRQVGLVKRETDQTSPSGSVEKAGGSRYIIYLI